jgi:hypothetical protein
MEGLMKVTGWVHLYGQPRAGIRFNNSIFTEPVPFSLALPPVSSGIYAILAPDASCRPRPFRVVYFGESDDFAQCVTSEHERFNEWATEAGGVANLYTAFCPTPLLKGEQRRWVEYDLVARYRPVCNLQDNEVWFFYQPLLSVPK